MRRAALALALTLTALTALASLASCAPAKSAPPPGDPGQGALFNRETVSIAPGTPVLVERGGYWLPATVTGRAAGDRVIVRYDGYSAEFDETVPIQRIRPGVAAAAPADYQVGERVLVSVQGKLLLADVAAQAGPQAWRVHYDGYGPEVAENVGPDRIRRPFAGATAHAPGAPVLVDVSGRTLPGTVLAPLAEDRWLVRFEGFGPEYDQEVTLDRLRGPGSPSPAAVFPCPTASS